MATIMVRVSEGQKELWVGAAHDERVSLSEWIRRRCDGGLKAEVAQIHERAADHPGARGTRSLDAGLMSGPPSALNSRPFRPDPKGGKVRGLGSGEVPAAGSPPVAGHGVSPEPSPLTAGEGSGSSQRADLPVDARRGREGGHSRTPDPKSSPAASGPKAFRPDPKKK